MASKTAAISVNVIADAAKFKAGLKDAEAAAGSFDNQMKNLAKGVAAAMGTAALIRFGTEAVKASLADAAAQVELQRQLEASTNASADQVAQVEEFIKTTQNATGVLDDQLRPAFATLTRFTQDATASQRLLNIALDISTATGKPLEAVSLALGKAYGGSTTALQKLGIQTKDAAGKALSFDQIQQNLIKTFGGATQAAAETTAGKIKIAQASFADMQEEIGAALVPALTAMMDVLTPIINAFNSLDADAQTLIVTAVAMAVAMKAGSTALQGLGVAAGTASMAMAPILVAFAALQAYSTWEAGKDKNRNETMVAYEAALSNVTTASKEQILSQYNLAFYALKTAKANGNLTDEVDLQAYAFRRLAQTSPATAKTFIELATANGAYAETTDKFNAILEEEIANTVELNARNTESAGLINEAALALEGYSTQWLYLKGLLSDRVMWDNLDTAFDNLQEKAAAAFGGSEQDVKDFNVAALQAAGELDKFIEKLDLPEEVQTKISILYDQGKFDQIYGLLRALDPAAVRQAFAEINGPFLPGMASGGTVTSSGMALVGENGPELLNLPTGASVIPLTNTSGGGNTINITVTSANPDDVIAAIKTWSRNNGAVPIRTTSTRTG